MRWSFRLFVVSCVLFFVACSQREIPVLGQIPNFQLSDQEGKAVSTKDLNGRVWIADFFFTSCAGSCPLLTQRMKGIQEFIATKVAEPDRAKLGLLSFSVDPERDTPERLKDYAKKFGADPKLWWFLTGPVNEITKTVMDGFKISMGKVALATPDPEGDAQPFDIVHGEKFVLIDPQGRIRGYYNSDEPESMKNLTQDMQFFLREKP